MSLDVMIMAVRVDDNDGKLSALVPPGPVWSGPVPGEGMMAMASGQRSRRHLLASATLGVALAASALTAPGAAAAAAPQLVTDPVALVNPLIGTSGGVNEFPGPDMPFGMIQWSPDTAPSRPDGGGYSYTADEISGFSLTHLSGPGCDAFGDVPVLPTVGAISSSPSSTTESFTHSTETAQAGYYAVTLGNGVRVQLTDATRAGIAKFTFPATTQANLLLNLTGSQEPDAVTTAATVGDDEVTGSVTSGYFCGEDTGWERDYTLHFDMVFNHPFTASGTWPASPIPGVGTPQGPGGEYLTFDTTADQTITAKVGISYTSTPNAGLNLGAEIPGWNFAQVRRANRAAWNGLLGKIQIAGGTSSQQAAFYTALYHALLDPSVFSDVNGQYTGFDGNVHTVPRGHAEYANYSGWDIYRSQVQLAAMVAPQQTSDAITSMLNDYAQTGQLPKWSLANGETYVQVGDPADPIIADAHAFGARDFNVPQALADMIHEATVPNDVRPGLAALQQDGYLPYDESYGCCNFYGAVSTQLEYDTADYAIASLALATGQRADYREFAAQAQSWQNIFNITDGYVQARQSAGQWLPGFSPSALSGFVEGTSAQYTPMVPFNLAGLIAARGGDAAWVSYLGSLLSDLTSPGPTNANLSDEPSLEIPYEYDYAGAPYLTQQVVREIEDQLYSDTPAGEPGNDDLGTLAAAYVWDELGFYPETPGTGVLALASPVFPEAVVHLPGGRRLTINAPAAQASAPYVQGLTVDGRTSDRAWVDYSSLVRGGTLDYDLSSAPDKSWASGAAAAPPSDPTGERQVLTSAGPAAGLILAPGASGGASFEVANLTGRPLTVNWTASAGPGTSPSGGSVAAAGVTVSPAGGTLSVPAHSTATAAVTVTAGTSSAEAAYPVTFASSDGPGSALPGTAVNADVAAPGEIWPYYTDIGITSDGQTVPSGYDGSSYTYSANALAADGLTPGAALTVGGVSYTWPDAPAGQPDSINSAGQTIPVSFPAGTTTIGLLGSGIDAGSGGATGTLTVTYTDGSTQQIPVALSDWTLGAGAYQPLPSETIVATIPYRDTIDGTSQPVPTHVYAISAALESGKTVASVTLPIASGGSIGIFAIGAG
jgi:predicted alpha-1,2-mannosidase